MRTIIKSICLSVLLTSIAPANLAFAEVTCKDWLGMWAGGKWNERRPGSLRVVKVSGYEEKCTATVVHKTGKHPDPFINAQYPGNNVTLKANIKGKKMTFNRPGGVVTYKMKGNRLSGTFQIGHSIWVDKIYLVKK